MIKNLVVIGIFSLSISGCASAYDTRTVSENAVGGALVGALAGAAIQSGGSWEEGARRGALGGAAAGILYGAHQSNQNRRQDAYYNQLQRQEAAARYGTTSCKSVYVNGHVSEQCTSSVSRPGYQNY